MERAVSPALVEAASVLGRSDWLDAARANAAFLATELRRDDGRWLRTWPVADGGIPAYGEDYAALLEAYLTMAELDDPSWLAPARELADSMLSLFGDERNGGVFTTGIDAEALIVRPKDVQDNATPAASSMAANGLLRLAALSGDMRYREEGRRWIGAVGPILAEHPTAFAYLASAFQRAVTPSIEVAIVAEPDDALREALVGELHRVLVPASVTMIAAPSTTATSTPLLEGRLGGRDAVAYVCEGFVCQTPARDPATLRVQLDAALAARRERVRS